MDPTFASLQQSFIDEWCGKFSSHLIYSLPIKSPFLEQGGAEARL